MRLALGCQRLTNPSMLELAASAGIRLFDTARAYGESERIVGQALREREPRIVTKCGMAEGWQPDGRASAIRADVAKSREALGLPIDTILLHAPDPSVSIATSLRALEAARAAGHTKRIGLSNVSLRQLEEASATNIPIHAVEVALGAYDDAPARGGVIRWCAERSIDLLAYAPFGGRERAPKLARDPILASVAKRLGATAHEVVLAYLLCVHPSIIPVFGATRTETLYSAIKATQLGLDVEALATLDARFPGLGMFRAPKRSPKVDGREIVMLAGIPGAGKSRAAQAWVDKGHERLNRDELGGTLKGIAKRLDERLHAGAHRFVLDNTYVTRALRSEIVRLAHAHGATLRCEWFDTPPNEAQRNLIQRILDRHDALPDDLAALGKRDPAVLAPSALSRMLKDLEKPTLEEGFDQLDIVSFVRAESSATATQKGTAIARAALGKLTALPGEGPILVFDWGNTTLPTFPTTDRPISFSTCPHAAGPPTCWCRPPLPGLWLAFAHTHRLITEGSLLVGTTPAHRTMATSLGMLYEEV